MQKLILLAVIVCLSTSSAHAEQVVVVHLPQKTPFAVKHPKLHNIGRGIRRTCQKLSPVVQFGGSCAQIVMMFTGRKG